jgi:hypothetical protein
VTSVGILRYDDVEVLDCCGPFEVFATATTFSDASPPSTGDGTCGGWTTAGC